MAHAPEKDTKPDQHSQALTETSGQGTDGACCEAMREAAAKKVEGEVIHHRFRTWPWWGDGNRDKQDALVQFCDLCAKAIRALPLPPSPVRDAVIEECATVASQYPTPAALAIAANIRVLKSKQPDTGAGE